MRKKISSNRVKNFQGIHFFGRAFASNFSLIYRPTGSEYDYIAFSNSIESVINLSVSKILETVQPSTPALNESKCPKKKNENKKKNK